MSVSNSARHGFRERSNHVLARPRELRGRMVKGLVLMKLPHLTKRAADGGYVPVFRHLSGFGFLPFRQRVGPPTHRS